jgi:hypothetical protein
MTRRPASPGKTLSQHRQRAGAVSRKVAEKTRAVIAEAVGLGLTYGEARALAAANVAVAARIAAEPQRRAEIEREADRATTNVVMRALERIARRAA